MHELAIATPLLRIVLEEAAAQEEKQGVELVVTSITLVVGVLVDLEAQTLQNCFELLAETTRAHGAELKVVMQPMQGHCRACKREVSTTKRMFACPFCSSRDVDWQKGHGMYIEAIAVKPALSITS